MANFTLDYTGEEVNELLGQVAAGGSGGGGVMRFTVTYEGIDEDTQSFINPSANKTYAEVRSVIDNGGFVVVDFDMFGANVFVPLQSIQGTETEGLYFTTNVLGLGVAVTFDNTDSVFVEFIVPTE